MTNLKRAAMATTGLALVSLTTASANNHAERPKVQLVAQLGAKSTALDASPDPTGKVIYYTTGGDAPAIFSVPATGGAQRKILRGGGVLKRPEGLAVSNDGKRLYVADTKAGRILVVRVRDGVARVLRGTAGSAPRGLEIQRIAGRDHVVYSGKASDGSAAILRISVRGANKPSVVAKGAPLAKPDGVAIARSGVVYVTDHGCGCALRIDGTTVSRVASGIELGDPAGLALTYDESHLLISSLNASAGTAQVVVLHLADGTTSIFDDVISANRSAGGLHRARAAVPMGWSGVQRPGRVYRVDP